MVNGAFTAAEPLEKILTSVPNDTQASAAETVADMVTFDPVPGAVLPQRHPHPVEVDPATLYRVVWPTAPHVFPAPCPPMTMLVAAGAVTVTAAAVLEPDEAAEETV